MPGKKKIRLTNSAEKWQRWQMNYVEMNDLGILEPKERVGYLLLAVAWCGNILLPWSLSRQTPDQYAWCFLSRFWGYALSHWSPFHTDPCQTCLCLCLIKSHFPYSVFSFPVLRASVWPQSSPPSAQCCGHTCRCYMPLSAVCNN